MKNMNWKPVNEVVLSELSEDSKMDFGSYLLITEFGQISQVKCVKGKLYFDTDFALHYPYTQEQLESYTYIAKFKNPNIN